VKRACKSGTDVLEEERERSKRRSGPLQGEAPVKTGSEAHDGSRYNLEEL
jgi:hypothetical protein